MKVARYISSIQLVTMAIFSLMFAGVLWANESVATESHDMDNMEGMEFNLESVDKPESHEMTMGHHAFAHPFLVHMGVPDGPGEVSVRATAMQRATDSDVSHDMALHIETGLWNRIGLHIRDDAVNMGKAEVMLQYAVLLNEHGDSGISTFVEMEFPAGYVPEDYEPEVEIGVDGRKIFGMYGIIDGGVHYGPQESMVSFEASGLLRLTPTIFPIIEGFVEKMKDEETMASLLAAIKVRLRPGMHAGAGMQFALTDYRDFDNQALFQLDIAY